MTKPYCLAEVYLFASMPASLRRAITHNPVVKQLIETRSIAHLFTGYILNACRPNRGVEDVIRAYCYLVALRMKAPGYAVPSCGLDWAHLV